jgi:hypothetical protein
METRTAREEFCQQVSGVAQTRAQEIWTTVLDCTKECAETRLRARSWFRRKRPTSWRRTATTALHGS